MNKVWIVSYSNINEDPVVTAFNNYANAYKYYKYEMNNKHDKVNIDECEVYSVFAIKQDDYSKIYKKNL